MLFDTDPSRQTVTAGGGAVAQGNVTVRLGRGTRGCVPGAALNSQTRNIAIGTPMNDRANSEHESQASLSWVEREGMRAL